MEIQADNYTVWHDSASATVYFQGFLRLNGIEEYQPIMDLLVAAIEASPNLTVNLQKLEFLNSSGISMLSMFVVRARQRGDVQLTLHGTDTILWQTKSLKNLQRLMPTLTLAFT
ncbi:slr1659 superfamily regulator [Egbenema bharatensis]|uniref:slr1659 superfamily regulator n=1 Tax=Egbenema bharatensis TaxID=3463334 RepID=UPI003A8779B0